MAAAPTSTGASQDGASSPSSRVRAACQAMSPAPAAARRRFRILPSKAAGSSGNIANRGASSTGDSGGELNRSEKHNAQLQSQSKLLFPLLLLKKKKKN